MADAFLSEISLFGFNFAPVDWAACDGQVLPITQNQALYSLIGYTYGGDGQTTFGLPQLQGRVTLSAGTYTDPSGSVSYTRGMVGGAQYVTLTAANLPSHYHNYYATSSQADFPANFPNGMQLGVNQTGYSPTYRVSSDLKPMNSAAISSSGGGQSHDNLQPFLAVLFCICTDGTYPSHS